MPSVLLCDNKKIMQELKCTQPAHEKRILYQDANLVLYYVSGIPHYLISQRFIFCKGGVRVNGLLDGNNTRSLLVDVNFTRLASPSSKTEVSLM